MRVALDIAIVARTHLDVGRRVRAVDRDNVGHVQTIDDTHGTCTIHFESVDGRTALRTIDWEHLIVIDNRDPTTITQAAATNLERRLAAVADAEREWAAALATHGVQPGDADC